MPHIEFHVFASRDGSRPVAHARLRSSLARSDVGQYHWHTQECEDPWEHWERVHRRAAESSARFVAVLEDDIVVNQHLRHNLESAPALGDPIMGAVFGFNLQAYASSVPLGESKPLERREAYCTQCVVYPTDRLVGYVEQSLRLRSRNGRWYPWDVAITRAVYDSGTSDNPKRVLVHNPSLIEHPDDLPSLMNPETRRWRHSGGSFCERWRRA